MLEQDFCVTNPYTNADTSNGVAGGGAVLRPPFTMVGWDQFAPTIQEVTANPANISHVDYLARFGRPLYGRISVIVNEL